MVYTILPFLVVFTIYQFLVVCHCITIYGCFYHLPILGGLPLHYHFWLFLPFYQSLVVYHCITIFGFLTILPFYHISGRVHLALNPRCFLRVKHQPRREKRGSTQVRVELAPAPSITHTGTHRYTMHIQSACTCAFTQEGDGEASHHRVDEEHGVAPGVAAQAQTKPGSS